MLAETLTIHLTRAEQLTLLATLHRHKGNLQGVKADLAERLGDYQASARANRPPQYREWAQQLATALARKIGVIEHEIEDTDRAIELIGGATNG